MRIFFCNAKCPIINSSERLSASVLNSVSSEIAKCFTKVMNMWLDEICKHQDDFEKKYLEQLVFISNFLKVGIGMRMYGSGFVDFDVDHEKDHDHSVQRNIVLDHVKLDFYKKLATQFPSKFQPELMYQFAINYYVKKYKDSSFIAEPKREEFGLPPTQENISSMQQNK